MTSFYEKRGNMAPPPGGGAPDVSQSPGGYGLGVPGPRLQGGWPSAQSGSAMFPIGQAAGAGNQLQMPQYALTPPSGGNADVAGIQQAMERFKKMGTDMSDDLAVEKRAGLWDKIMRALAKRKLPLGGRPTKLTFQLRERRQPKSGFVDRPRSMSWNEHADNLAARYRDWPTKRGSDDLTESKLRNLAAKYAAQDNSLDSRSATGEGKGLTYKTNDDDHATGTAAWDSLGQYMKKANEANVSAYIEGGMNERSAIKKAYPDWSDAQIDAFLSSYNKRAADLEKEAFWVQLGSKVLPWAARAGSKILPWAARGAKGGKNIVQGVSKVPGQLASGGKNIVQGVSKVPGMYRAGGGGVKGVVAGGKQLSRSVLGRAPGGAGRYARGTGVRGLIGRHPIEAMLTAGSLGSMGVFGGGGGGAPQAQGGRGGGGYRGGVGYQPGQQDQWNPAWKQVTQPVGHTPQTPYAPPVTKTTQTGTAANAVADNTMGHVPLTYDNFGGRGWGGHSGVSASFPNPVVRTSNRTEWNKATGTGYPANSKIAEDTNMNIKEACDATGLTPYQLTFAVRVHEANLSTQQIKEGIDKAGEYMGEEYVEELREGMDKIASLDKEAYLGVALGALRGLGTVAARGGLGAGRLGLNALRAAGGGAKALAGGGAKALAAPVSKSTALVPYVARGGAMVPYAGRGMGALMPSLAKGLGGVVGGGAKATAAGVRAANNALIRILKGGRNLATGTKKLHPRGPKPYNVRGGNFADDVIRPAAQETKRGPFAPPKYKPPAVRPGKPPAVRPDITVPPTPPPTAAGASGLGDWKSQAWRMLGGAYTGNQAAGQDAPWYVRYPMMAGGAAFGRAMPRLNAAGKAHGTRALWGGLGGEAADLGAGMLGHDTGGRFGQLGAVGGFASPLVKGLAPGAKGSQWIASKFPAGSKARKALTAGVVGTPLAAMGAQVGDEYVNSKVEAARQQSMQEMMSDPRIQNALQMAEQGGGFMDSLSGIGNMIDPLLQAMGMDPSKMNPLMKVLLMAGGGLGIGGLLSGNKGAGMGGLGMMAIPLIAQMMKNQGGVQPKPGTYAPLSGEADSSGIQDREVPQDPLRHYTQTAGKDGWATDRSTHEWDKATGGAS